MIIKGKPAGSVGFWSKHLLRTDTNEKAEIKEIRGLLADNLPTALREMQAVASGSRSHGNFMYQANINPLAHEHLTLEQWKESIDLLEKNLGLEGHQRVVVEHIKEGRQHYHVIWNRVDVDNLRVADMGGNYYSHERTARELEQRFGLEPTPRVHGEREGPRTQERPPEQWEEERAAKTGIDVDVMKAELTQLWRTTDSGKAFAAAIEERGYALAKGDRRDFCVIDQAGDEHSLARRLEGVKAKEVREHMADVDRDTLPSVREASERQKERVDGRQFVDRDAADRVWQSKVNDAGIATDEADRKQQQAVMSELGKAARADDATLRGQENAAYWKEYRENQDAATTRRTDQWEKQVAADRRKGGGQHNRLELSPERAVIKVADSATGVLGKLVDFLENLLTGGSGPPPRDPNQDQVDRIIEERRADAALDRIRLSMERGEGLAASDVRNLTRDQMENIRSKGDDALIRILEQMERDRQRERDDGRSRER